MKYFFIALVCLFGCSSERASFQDSEKIKILSTTAMIDDLVGRVGKDRIQHFPLIVGEVDPHSYELVKGDDEKMAYADLIVANGLGLEHGASLRTQLLQHKHAIYLGDEIQKKVGDRILTVNGQLDPHVWMDISLWAEGLDAIVDALCKEDPDNREFYVMNAVVAKKELLEKHRLLQEKMQRIPSEKRYLVTSHDAFHYFARAYLGDDGEDRCVAPEGLAPEGQLSSQDIRRVVDHLSEHKIGVVFPESNVSRAALRKIVTCCNHPVHCSDQSLYGDAMGEGDYLFMIEHNVKVLGDEWTN